MYMKFVRNPVTNDLVKVSRKRYGQMDGQIENHKSSANICWRGPYHEQVHDKTNAKAHAPRLTQTSLDLNPDPH